MFIAPYRNDKPYDEYFERTILKIKEHIEDKDDDYVILLVGATGGGKSTLAMHILDTFMPKERLNIKQMALSKEEFASSLKAISIEPKPRALVYDEANVNKRDALSKWNKELLDLYFSCRGLNIFHIWCNPSLEMIDKPFLEDRLRAIILLRGKQKKKPRMMYYFRKDDILKIFDKYENLNIKTITKVRKKYAWFRGWFKDYDGILKKQYREKKLNRMKVKVDKFFDKYADDKTYRRGDIKKILGIGDSTIDKYNKFLIPDTDYKINAAGRYHYTEEGINHLRLLFLPGIKNKNRMNEKRVIKNE